MKTKKRIVAIIMAVAMLMMSILVVSAFQMGNVSKLNINAAGVDCYGYSYLHRYATAGSGALASAETEISVRTPDVSELYVQYYFIRNLNQLFLPMETVTWPDDYYAADEVPTTYRITPTYSYTVDNHSSGKYFISIHKVTVIDDTDPDVSHTWQHEMREYDANWFQN